MGGEGEGPLAPDDRPLGVVLAALDPVALDVAAVRLMGFDESRIPKLSEAMRSERLRVTGVRSSGDVRVVECCEGRLHERSLAELEPERAFLAHPGWRGHLENERCAA